MNAGRSMRALAYGVDTASFREKRCIDDIKSDPDTTAVQSDTVPDISGHASAPLLPPVRPARTVDTSFCLLANILPAVFALDLLLDNVIVRTPRIRKRDNPKRQRNAYEAYDLVQETSVGEHHGAVVERLRHGVVAVGDGAVVVRTVFEDGELLVEVAREEGEEGDDG